MRTLLLALLLLGSAAGEAGAGPGPRYERSRPTTGPIAPAARPHPRPATSASTAAAAPAVTLDEVLELQRDATEIGPQQIELLARALASTPATDVAEKANAYLLVAEAYAQLDRFHRLLASEATIQADRATAAADKRRLRTVAAGHSRAAADALRKAIKHYRAISDDRAFASYPDLDRALFSFAYTLQQAAFGKQAEAIYQRLLADHPQSRYVPAAYLALADYHVARKELADAEALYRKVLVFPASRVVAYANYRLGWVALDQHQAEAAGTQFLQVIRDAAGKPEQETLALAARKDFVRAFADFGQVQKAWAVFQQLDAAEAAAMYETLADLYAEQGQGDRAIYAYRELMKEQPASAHLCRWQAAAAQALLSAPGATQVQIVDEVAALARVYQATRDRKLLPAADAAECHDRAAAMACDLARSYHSEAVRTRSVDAMAHADRLYGTCLATFPDVDVDGESQYYQAELGWSRAGAEPDARRQTALWEQAAGEFTAVVKAGKVDPKLRKEAAYAAVLAWKNALAVDPAVGSRRPLDDGAGGVPAAVPIPDRDEKLIGAFHDYLPYVTDPKDPELAGIVFLEANLYRRYNQFAKATPLLERIITSHPEHETALYAANTILDVAIITRDQAQLARWAHYLHDHPAFYAARRGQDRSDLAARVEEVLTIAARRSAEQCEVEARTGGAPDRFVACGDQYLAIFEAAVAAGVKEHLDEVLINAGVMYEEGRSPAAAIAAYEQLRARFPSSPLAARAQARLAVLKAHATP